MAVLPVDIVSDFVCPWCLIGSHRLGQAIASRPEIEVKLTYRPFLLDPSTPDEGVDLRTMLKKKYGDPEPMFRRVEKVAQESGIPLDFSKVQRSVPTVRAHILARHAIEKGTQAALAKATFEAHFLEGRDISSMDVLIDLGTAHGFTREEVITLLDRTEEKKITKDEARGYAEAGITGVPFTIVAERVAVPGAQAMDVFQKALDQVRDADASK